MRIFIRRLGFLLAGVLAFSLSGCIPVPIPPLGYPGESRTNLPDRVPDFIVKGKTTREQVLFALGAPDAYAADGGWMAYRSSRHAGGVAFVVGGGYSAGVVGPVSGYENRLLVVRFDANSVVIDVALEQRTCLTANDAGCSGVPQLSIDPKTPPADFNWFYVVPAATDALGIDRLILAELNGRGLKATSGPADAVPGGADAIITYRAAWSGDGSMELAYLIASVQTPGSGNALATAAAIQTPIAPRASSVMVSEVVGQFFAESQDTFLILSPYAATATPSRDSSFRGATVYVEAVQDARGVARGNLIGQRSALGVSMGKIDMTPSPTAMVRQLLVSELENLGGRSVQAGAHVTVEARLTRFEVQTPSTLLYWDVNGVIAIDVGVKRGHDERRHFQYQTACTNRTYLGPSQSVVGGVVYDCLKGLGAQVREDPILAGLLVAE
jgi:hypothetical protein